MFWYTFLGAGRYEPAKSIGLHIAGSWSESCEIFWEMKT